MTHGFWHKFSSMASGGSREKEGKALLQGEIRADQHVKHPQCEPSKRVSRSADLLGFSTGHWMSQNYFTLIALG